MQITLRGALILILCLTFTEQQSTPQDDSYIAAVLEYEVQSDILTNVQNYHRLISEAAEQNADIVVFPEMTLTRGDRAVKIPINGLLIQQPIPALAADLYDEILVNMSSAARQNSVYVVINIQEELDCTTNNITEEHCPENKRYLFNTNVVFDRQGRVIDRYRKINLFGELTRTPAFEPDLGIFTTDFGVTFGHFICFDLMFQVPAVQLVNKHNLTDIIFTTMWFSEMPYLTAVQIQEAYAYAMEVNFIASGANNVRVGSAGSGIYSGKAGALVSIMPGVPKTRLLVSRVPKVPGKIDFQIQGPIYDEPSDHDSLVLISDPSLPSHQSRLLVSGFQEFTIVDKEVSCKFTVRLSQRDGSMSHRYRAFVHDGINTYARRQAGVASCSLVSCKDDNDKHCAFRFKDNDVNIEELEIEMTAHRLQFNKSLQCENIVYYPSTLRSNKFPLNHKNYTFTEMNVQTVEQEKDQIQEQRTDALLQDDDSETSNQNEGRIHITFKINSPQDELVAFGVWGRLFLRDVDHTLQYTVTEQDLLNYTELENNIFAIITDEADI